MATWSNEESSTESEEANLCLMAIQEDEVSSNSSFSNFYTFDEFQDAYDDLILEFKASISKNKKLLLKLKFENEVLSKANIELEAKCVDYKNEILNLKICFKKFKKKRI
ncbi:hypothetical protein GQ457_08G036160 [Hibiscus cannabinus]